MKEKTCTKCEEKKTISNFRRDRSRKDGFHPYCKSCQQQYRRKDPNNLVRIEGERRRHREYNLRQRGRLKDELTPSQKSTKHLKKYYRENPEAIELIRGNLTKDGEPRMSSYHLKWKNSVGEKYRSSLEVQFSELLIRNNIPYEYEVIFPLVNGKRKVVDFLIDKCLIVEVSGYAYKAWQDDFDSKMKLLMQSTDLQILVLTYDNKLKELTNNLFKKRDIYFDDIDNEKHILRGINFYRQIYKINKQL